MTQTLKKHEYQPKLKLKSRTRNLRNQRKYKEPILNYLFRNISFQTRTEKIRTVSSNEYRIISKETGFSVDLIQKIISRFLANLIRINQFLNYYTLLNI